MKDSTTYRTRGFVKGSSFKWILIISQVSLILIIPLILIGMPVMLIAAIFIVAIVIGFLAVSGDVIFTVDDQGITKEVESIFMKGLWKKHAFQFYPWSEIESFITGRNADRSYKEFHYLTITTRKDGKLEINTKRGDEGQFHAFVAVFRHFVQMGIEGKLKDADRPISVRYGDESANRRVIIKEEPSFFRSGAAKVVTWLAVIILAGLFLMMIITGSFRFSNVFRLSFILVPGVIYMVYRIYFDDRPEEG